MSVMNDNTPEAKAARGFITRVYQSGGQSKEDREQAAEATALVAGFTSDTLEAQEWISDVLNNVYMNGGGSYEGEAAYVLKRIQEQKNK